MADTQKPPCVPFPQAKTIAIPLPFGSELRSITDISKGPPTDCALAHSLMLQLSPMLASMQCLLKILKVFAVLKEILDSANPVTLVDGLLGKLPPALADLLGCFLIFDPCELSKMIAGILRMILAYIGCLIEAFESIWNLQLSYDLTGAQGNPVVLASLNCAKDNAEASMTSLAEAMQAIEPLLTAVGGLLELVGLPPLELPPLSGATPTLGGALAPGEDPLKPVKTLRDTLQAAHDALPCK
jgi:hypothetical protein